MSIRILLAVLSILVPLIYTIFYQLALQMNTTIVTKPNECLSNNDNTLCHVLGICDMNVDCGDHIDEDIPTMCNTQVSWMQNCDGVAWWITALIMGIIGNTIYFALIYWRLNNIKNNLILIANGTPNGPLSNDIPQINGCLNIAKCVGLCICVSGVFGVIFCVPKHEAVHTVFAFVQLFGLPGYQILHVIATAYEVGYNSNRTYCQILLLVIFSWFAGLSVLFIVVFVCWVSSWYLLYAYIWHYAFYSCYLCNCCGADNVRLADSNIELVSL